MLRLIHQGIFEKESVIFCGVQGTEVFKWCFFHKDCELDRDNVAILKQLALSQQDAVFLTSCLVTGREIRRDRSYIFYVISDLLFWHFRQVFVLSFLSKPCQIFHFIHLFPEQPMSAAMMIHSFCFNVSTPGLIKNHRRYKHVRMSSALICAVLIATKIRFLKENIHMQIFILENNASSALHLARKKQP